MATIQDIGAPWRRRFVPASFNRVEFHVESQSRSSGRRTVVHEYPKRDTPYSEDMGRHAIRYQVTGEGGGEWYVSARDGERLEVTREPPVGREVAHRPPAVPSRRAHA